MRVAAIIFSLFVLFLQVSESSGNSSNIFTVAPDGSGDFQTIQDAIIASNDGDIIELLDGGNLSAESNEVPVVPLGSPSDPPSTLAPDSLEVFTGIYLDLPIYGAFNPQALSDPVTSEEYDALAEYDTYIFGHEFMFDDRYIGLVDAVRTRNPKFIPLNYVWGYGVRSDWAEASGVYRDLWDMTDRNSDGPQTDGIDFWLYDASGDTVEIVSQPGFTSYAWNHAAPGLIDSLVNYYTDRLVEMGHPTDYCGFFWDYFDAGTYAPWQFVGGEAARDSIDMNEDGWAYGALEPIPNPVDEPGMYNDFVVSVAGAARAAAGDSTFLTVPNGSAGYASSTKGYFDGGMYEIFQSSYMASTKERLDAEINKTAVGGNRARVNYPLTFWQTGVEIEAGPTSEIIASMAGNVACFYLPDEGIYPLPEDLMLGKRVGDTTWSGDTITAYFSSNQYDTTARVVWGYPTLPWDLIVFTDQNVVLRRVGDWPAYSGYTDYDTFD